MSSSTVSAFIGAGGSREKDPAPSPLINITVHPPSHAILSREGPLYLPCEAIYTGADTSLDSDPNYYDFDDQSDDDLPAEDDDDDQHGKMRDTHFTDLRSDASVVSSDFGDGNELHKRELLSASDHRKPHIFYSWLLNDEPFEPSNDTKIFANGTLRLTHSHLDSASGSFRCVANSSVPGAGTVLSTATQVQHAGKFESKRT